MAARNERLATLVVDAGGTQASPAVPAGRKWLVRWRYVASTAIAAASYSLQFDTAPSSGPFAIVLNESIPASRSVEHEMHLSLEPGEYLQVVNNGATGLMVAVFNGFDFAL